MGDIHSVTKETAAGSRSHQYVKAWVERAQGRVPRIFFMGVHPMGVIEAELRVLAQSLSTMA